MSLGETAEAEREADQPDAPEQEPAAPEPDLAEHPLHLNGGESVEHTRGDELLGPRLVALQMAVAGGRRGEVEDHLRRAFDLADCERILDDVFGPGSDADARVAWPDLATGGG